MLWSNQWAKADARVERERTLYKGWTGTSSLWFWSSHWHTPCRISQMLKAPFHRLSWAALHTSKSFRPTSTALSLDPVSLVSHLSLCSLKGKLYMPPQASEAVQNRSERLTAWKVLTEISGGKVGSTGSVILEIEQTDEWFIHRIIESLHCRSGSFGPSSLHGPQYHRCPMPVTQVISPNIPLTRRDNMARPIKLSRSCLESGKKPDQPEEICANSTQSITRGRNWIRVPGAVREQC